MFLNSSLAPLSFAPPSGFVAFDGGGVAEADAHRAAEKATAAARQAAAPLVRPAPQLEAASAPEGLLQSATWQPMAGVFARRVEGAVIIAMCSYFVFGFARLVGLI